MLSLSVYLSVCLLTRLGKKLWMNADEISVRVSFVTSAKVVRFWGDLHSDLDPVILFFLHLFAVALLYYCLLVSAL